MHLVRLYTASISALSTRVGSLLLPYKLLSSQLCPSALPALGVTVSSSVSLSLPRRRSAPHRTLAPPSLSPRQSNMAQVEQRTSLSLSHLRRAGLE